VIADLDVWRAANLLVKWHGRDAAIVAAQRADERLASGDVDGQAAWRRIVETIFELLRSRAQRGASRLIELRPHAARRRHSAMPGEGIPLGCVCSCDTRTSRVL
jgi:hypothetical protein